MNALRLLAGPALLALRRLRARPLLVLAFATAVAAACALIGWSSVGAALAQERNVRLRIGEVTPAERSVQVVYHLATGDSDREYPRVAAFFRSLRDVTGVPRSYTVWHRVVPGTEIVVGEDALDHAALAAGHLPRHCE